MVVGLWVPWLTEFLCFLRSFSPAFPSFPGGPRVIKPTHPPPLALHYPLAPFTSRLTANTYTHAHTHTLKVARRGGTTHIVKSASLKPTSSRLLMNECFLYLSSNRKGAGWRERWWGDKRGRERRQLRSSFTSGPMDCSAVALCPD